MSKILITGINGQIGSHLADLLLEEGHEVHGLIRRVSTPNTKNISHIIEKITLHDGDITDLTSLISVLKEVQPGFIANMAAQSFVGISWSQPTNTANITALGAMNVFEAARQVCKEARIYQSSSSEMFGGDVYPQNEKTEFKPRSPYGISKLFAHQMCRCYRESYDMYCSSGIMFNSEGPRRGIEFITQKIVDAAVRQLVSGENLILKLGNLDSCRDWSHSKDTTRGIWKVLNYTEPDDFVLSSGETHSIKEFANLTYSYLGEKLYWHDEESLPVGVNSLGQIRVKSVPEFFRPSELWTLQGDSSKAREILGWKPEYSFQDLLADMVEAKIGEVKANISR